MCLSLSITWGNSAFFFIQTYRKPSCVNDQLKRLKEAIKWQTFKMLLHDIWSSFFCWHGESSKNCIFNIWSKRTVISSAEKRGKACSIRESRQIQDSQLYFSTNWFAIYLALKTYEDQQLFWLQLCIHYAPTPFGFRDNLLFLAVPNILMWKKSFGRGIYSKGKKSFILALCLPTLRFTKKGSNFYRNWQNWC